MRSNGRSRLRMVLATTATVLASATIIASVLFADRAARAASVVMVGAGDIAKCGYQGDEATAKLLDNIGGTVFTLGDNAYPDGTYPQHRDCYGPSWGRHKDRTKPSAGNHEYNTPDAAGYFNYFGARAGPAGNGYYSYDCGSWHIVVLNSNCWEVSCAEGSAQNDWLEADLAANADHGCTLAYFHYPRFSSTRDHPSVAPFWQDLYAAGAEVVLNGHTHNYERFAPQRPDGTLDGTRGIREFVVGRGGAHHHSFGIIKPNSQARNSGTYGVLKLTLHSGSYDWKFVPPSGQDLHRLGHQKLPLRANAAMKSRAIAPGSSSRTS